jgi:hypothetical protein
MRVQAAERDAHRKSLRYGRGRKVRKRSRHGKSFMRHGEHFRSWGNTSDRGHDPPASIGERAKTLRRRSKKNTDTTLAASSEGAHHDDLLDKLWMTMST